MKTYSFNYVRRRQNVPGPFNTRYILVGKGFVPDKESMFLALTDEERVFLNEKQFILESFATHVKMEGIERAARYARDVFSPIFANNLINVYEKYYRRLP